MDEINIPVHVWPDCKTPDEEPDAYVVLHRDNSGREVYRGPKIGTAAQEAYWSEGDGNIRDAAGNILYRIVCDWYEPLRAPIFLDWKGGHWLFNSI